MVCVCPQTFLIDLAQAIKRLYINIVDLEHEGHKGNVNTVQKFPSEVALSEYTLRTKKIYRRNLVPKGSLLELLLRHILSPQPKKAGKDRTGSHKKKPGKQKGAELK